MAYIKDGAVQVRNRQTGQTEQITKGINGDAPDGDSQAPQISADGRWVAFWSWAGNLASDDTKVCRENETLNYSCGDVFLFDRETGELSRIDVGEPYGLGMGSYHLSISGDGQYVAFFDKVYNRANGQIEPLCGTREQSCSAGVLSEDGRRVAYASGADFFVFDRTTGKRELVSVSSDGTPGNGEPIDFMISSEGESFQPGFDISGDGHLVVFASTASNLAPSDKAICSNSLFAPHNCLDIFMHDLSTGKTARISKSGQ